MINEKIKKLSFFTFGLIIVILFSAFLVKKNLNNSKFTGPKIEFTYEKIAFGDVKMGPMVDSVYEFKNTGRDTLKIINVQPSCGCTGIVADEKKDFMPGETGKIKFTFNTEGHMGINNKSINLTTNDANKTTISLSFTINVIQ